jgi:hypothetical protein
MLEYSSTYSCSLTLDQKLEKESQRERDIYIYIDRAFETEPEIEREWKLVRLPTRDGSMGTHARQ